MSEFEKEYRIAQLLAKKMAGELSPEEKLELHEWENTSLSATELNKRILDPANKRQRDEFVNSLDTKSSWQKVEKGITRKKHTSPKPCLVVKCCRCNYHRSSDDLARITSFG